MPTTLEAPRPLEPPDPPRKRWTREEVNFLEDQGLFLGQRYELVEGDLINRMGAKPPHVSALSLMLGWLYQVFGPDRVQPPSPIDVAPQDNPTSEPEPDAAVLNRSTREFARDRPDPADIVLIVEVSDTSLRFDRTTKAGLYARAGVQDYWILDINHRRLVVHRDPVDGLYRSVTAYEENEAVAPLAAPNSFARASDFLP
jgi:Uma2 family endonuclease